MLQLATSDVAPCNTAMTTKHFMMHSHIADVRAFASHASRVCVPTNNGRDACALGHSHPNEFGERRATIAVAMRYARPRAVMPIEKCARRSVASPRPDDLRFGFSPPSQAPGPSPLTKPAVSVSDRFCRFCK